MSELKRLREEVRRWRIGIRIFLKNVANWLFREPLELWITLFGLVIGILIVYFDWHHDLSLRMRSAATGLQVSGTFTVVVGVIRTRRQFMLPSPFGIVMEWLRRFPTFRLPRVHQAAVAMDVTAEATASGHVVKVPAGASTEQRIRALEKQLTKLSAEIKSVKASITAAKANLDLGLANEAKLRKENLEALENLLRVAQTGNLNINVMGMTWLLAGIILGTMPTEVLTLTSVVWGWW